MRINVKICGLKTPEMVAVSAEAGATAVGFVFFPPSPRAVTVEQARVLAESVPPGIDRVALVVDADDAVLEQIVAQVPLDILQLHGCETPERVAQIRRDFGLPTMKAIAVADALDLRQIERYVSVADKLLFDARASTDAKRPGGNARCFDWQLLHGMECPVPWMLAGGLHAGNVGEALRITQAKGVDVSSGVESSPGCKSEVKIWEFIQAVRQAERLMSRPLTLAEGCVAAHKLATSH